MVIFEETFVNEEQLPVVWQIVRGQDAPLPEVVAWFREHEASLVEARDRYGAVLVRGFESVDSARSFSAVLESIAPELMDYVGGSAPRTAVHGRVFNATALPGSFTLPLHQEMAYQEHRPDSLALYCHVLPSEGGETTLADARAVTASIDPAVRARCEHQLHVVRALPRERVETRTRPWMDVFGTADRDEVRRIAAEKEWRVEWFADDSMQLRQRMPSFRTHPRTGTRVWANQLHYHTPEGMLNWALRDGRAEDIAHFSRLRTEAPHLLDHVFHEDGTPVSSEEADHIWEVLLRAEVPLRWQRGDVLILDNVLAMHGRRTFRGERSVLVGMIREEKRKSSEATLRPEAR